VNYYSSLSCFEIVKSKVKAFMLVQFICSGMILWL